MRWTSGFPNGAGAYWYRDDNTEAEVRCFIGGRCYNPHDKNYYTWDQLPDECEFSDYPVQYPLEVKKERLWMNWGKEGKDEE